jgi:hypothetical protein
LRGWPELVEAFVSASVIVRHAGISLQRFGPRAERLLCSQQAAFPSMGPRGSVTRPVGDTQNPTGIGTYALPRHDAFGAPLTIASTYAEMRNAE